MPQYTPNGNTGVSVSGSFSLSGSGFNLFKNNNLQIRDTLTWIKGRHELKAGGKVLKLHFLQRFIGPPGFTFTGSRSGDAFADYLLGAFDVCFAWIIGIGHRGTGRPLNPKRVEFQRAPAHREMYEAHFLCPVKFKSNQNALIFSRADMELPFVTYNADLLAAVAPQLEAELREQLAQKTVSEQAKGILKRLLAGQRPGIDDLARELHLSTRTLQRRLTEQGITFQRLLEEARREVARHYLLHSSVELSEAAYLLGYEDVNSFFRAFHQWEGTSPGQWKTSQANPA
jgi:AraC-like DNA-binding protein